ncbi:MAG: hypothetical protein E7505_10920 [Ruminococcus sp.]|nr:hypothetical protein [Ruminococcus sp.]
MAIKFGNSGNSQSSDIQQSAAVVPVSQTPVSAQSSDFKRYIGYDDANTFEGLLTELYAKAKNNGIFFDKAIPNPANPEITKISSITQIPNQLDRDAIKNIISSLQSANVLDLSKIGTNKTADETAAIIDSVLQEVRLSTPSPNAAKNVFVKFICWIIRYSTYNVTNVLYVGSITKHEVLWLYLISLMGCSVSYVNYTNETGYLEGDPSGKYSELIRGSVLAPLDINLSRINIDQYNRQLQSKEQLNEIVSASSPIMLKYLQTAHEYISKDILSTLDLRQAKLICTDTTIPIYFTAYIGYDEQTVYNNMLFSLREELDEKGKQYIFIEDLRKPSYQEAADYYSISKTNDSDMITSFASKITINDNIGRTVLAQKAFIEALGNIQTNNLYNTAVQLAVWFRKVTSQFDFFKSDTPMIFYYGNISAVELTFLNMMSKSGIDVFYFNPDKSVLPLINTLNFTNLQIIERKESCSGMPFPDKMIKTKMATTAYAAEKSLDSILYNDNTMFRTHQFSVSRNQTLKTTYEELGLMWHQQAMYRTGFDSKNNYVIVPNLFAKINGIAAEDLQSYYKEIAFKLAPMSAYYHKVPFFKPTATISRDAANQLSNGLKIDIEALRQSRYNKYDYMNDNLQYLIFNKLQEVIDSGFINVPESDIVPLVLTAGLNIPNNLLQILQKFDFTKDIPKIVIVSSGKQTFAVFECILLVLFNLIGFDIIIYTPTGYKNLESFIRPEAFEEFTLGNYKYDFIPQSLKIPKEIPQEKTSFFGRIFKGKK